MPRVLIIVTCWIHSTVCVNIHTLYIGHVGNRFPSRSAGCKCVTYSGLILEKENSEKQRNNDQQIDRW